MKNTYTFKTNLFTFVHIIFVAFLLSFAPQLYSQEKPGPNNTGPTGTLEARSGGTITVDGTVIENKHVTGCLHIKASNVTIRNCVVDGNWDWYAIRCDYGAQYTNLLIEDCELINGSSAIVKGSNFTALRCNLHDANGDAFKPVTNCLVEYCWIHHLGLGVDAHADGVQSLNGGSDMTFRYNNFDMSYYVEDPYKSNSPFIVQSTNGIVSMLVEYNWINGGSYTMNLGNNEVIVRYNKFGRDYAYGIFYPGADNYNSCNVWEDTGEPIDDCDGGVDVTGVTLSPAYQTLSEGQSISLTATVEPNDATDKTVTWSSSNTSVATVINGLVTAVAEGMAVITVTTNDGDFTATSDITVTSGVSGGLNPVEDAYVRGGTYADDNFGTASILTIKNEANNPTYTRESYLKFDLSSLEGIPESAVLRLYLTSNNGYSTHSIQIVNDDSWTETGITYNNQPTAGTEVASYSTPEVDNWVEVDLLSAVQSEAGGLLSLKITSNNNSVNSFVSREGANKPELIIETLPLQAAYNGPHDIPGKIEAENYDDGGQDIAFNDDATKSGLSTYRPDDNIDVQATTDVDGGYNVGWTNNGEWIEYTIADIIEGNYDIQLRVASDHSSPGEIVVKLGDGPEGENFMILGTIDVQNTGNWQTFETLSITGIALDAATNKILRLEIVGGGINLNWMQFELLPPPVETSVLNPIEDAYVRDVYYADYNFGTESVLNVKKGYSSHSMESYMKFDLSGVSSSAIQSAFLRLYVNSIGGEMTEFIHLIDDNSWTETGITFNNRPDAGDQIASLDLSSAGSYIEIDVLQAAQAKAGGLLSLKVSTVERIHLLTEYSSREGANPPELVLETAASQEAALAPMADALVRAGTYADDNFGAESTYAVKYAPNSDYQRESYLKFDLSSVSAPVSSAILRVYLTSTNGIATHTIKLVSNDSWTENGITYNNKPAAGDIINTYQTSDAGDFIDVDIKSAVDLEAGSILSLQISADNDRYNVFDSKEGVNPPVLILNGTVSAVAVTGISVTPSNITLNEGISATLSVEVSPVNAANTNVTWSSSNTSVATVNSSGLVSAITEGTAVITATSVDGGYTDQCTVAVNAPSTSQLMNLDAPSSARFTLPQEIVWPANVGDADVCLWHNDKYAATSISIDDNIESQHAWWLSMTNKYPGMPFTWMAIPIMVNNWSSFQNLIDAGHVVDAHDRCEINDYTDADYRARLISVQDEINQTLNNNQCLTYAYPCGTPKPELIRDLFIVMRGVTGSINKANEINYLNLKSRSGLNDVHDIRILLDENELLWGKPYNRGWLSYHYHTIGETSTETFLAALHAKTDSIWVGSYADVAKYGQERDTHTLTVTEVNTDNIKFNLTDLMHDTYFDFPLTVKIRVPNNWNGLYATQNGTAIEVSLIENAGNKYALVKAVPDRGQVIVGDSGAKSQSKFFQMSSLSEALSVKVYPNPLSKNNVLSVSLNGGSDDAIDGVKIIDMAGRLVYGQNNVSAKTVMISEAGLLKKGVYILMIKSSSTLQKQKLIVE